MSGPVLVVCSPLLGHAGELLALARTLASHANGEVAALALGEVAAERLIGAGADVVYSAVDPLLDDGHVERMTAVAAQACRELEPAVVLMDHNAIGADLAPRLAFRLEGNAALGCVAVERADERLVFTRPRQGGIAHEALSFPRGVVVATVRAGHHEAAAADAARTGAVVALTLPPANGLRTRIVERRRDSGGAGPRLEDARIVVAGGRGVGGPEGFRVLETLASALGGVVGASRVPCDLGWCPRAWQIGLTGKTVLPEVYFAVGISGASHHMAGCGSAKAIVAINTDREAAIFREARYGVVADYRELIPALAAELRQGA